MNRIHPRHFALLAGFVTFLGHAPSGIVADGGKGKADNPWATAKTPAKGSAKSIGKYNAGCVRGAVALPDSGVGYQLARPSRRRNYGHPQLIDAVKTLAARAKEAKLGPLFVGDLGQVRGGPAPSGHSSHQSGLDADIWFWHPRAATRGVMSRKKRERTSAKQVVSVKTGKTTAAWTKKVPAILKLAASDDRVARIFINPLIKKELCRITDPDDRAWLAKLRPWWGHNAHFHMRLACPSGSADCVDQAPVKPGDGCGEIDWWLSEKSKADRKKGRKKYQKTVGSRPALPAGCAALTQ